MATKELVEQDENEALEESTIDPWNFKTLINMAQVLCRGIGVPYELKHKPDDAFAVIQAGSELGVPPMTALREFHVIKGKITIAASFMRSLCYQNPEICLYFKILERTDKRCTIEVQRAGYDPFRLTWTIEMAERARLLKSDKADSNWVKYPEAMLQARATTDIVKAIFPDLTQGMMSDEEVQDEDVEALRAAAARPISSVVVVPEPELNDAQKNMAGMLKAATSLEKLDEILPFLKAMDEEDKPPMRVLFAKREAELQEEAKKPAAPVSLSPELRTAEEKLIASLNDEFKKILDDSTPENVFNEALFQAFGSKISGLLASGDLTKEVANAFTARSLEALQQSPWSKDGEKSKPVPKPQREPDTRTTAEKQRAMQKAADEKSTEPEQIEEPKPTTTAEQASAASEALKRRLNKKGG
jgi:hypothetical protein